MILKCEKCQASFDASEFRGYCDACVQLFRDQKKAISDRQNPMPNVCLDGKFIDQKECPKSFVNPLTEESNCGLCGSDELEPGYGLGAGYGIGVYNFCFGCNTFLDFVEDSDE